MEISGIKSIAEFSAKAVLVGRQSDFGPATSEKSLYVKALNFLP